MAHWLSLCISMLGLPMILQGLANATSQVDGAFLSYKKTQTDSHTFVEAQDILILDFQAIDILNSSFKLITVNASFGTPQQLVNLIIGTSFADLLVVSPQITACQSNATNCNFGTFNANTSTTATILQNTFANTSTGETDLRGVSVTDNVRLGSETISALQFDWITSASTPFNYNFLGLGYVSSQSTNTSYANIPLRLYFDGRTEIVGYSTWFDGPSQTTGKLAFGAIDTAKFTNALTTLPIVLDRSRLQYTLTTIKMDNMSGLSNKEGTGVTYFANSTLNIALDTTNAGISLPQDLFNSVVKYLGATVDEASGSGLAVLNKTDYKPDTELAFAFGQTRVQIPLEYVVFPFPLNDYQLGLRIFNDDRIILGIPFFRGAYVVFDYSHNQISIAQSSYSSDSNLSLINVNGVGVLQGIGNSAASTDISSNQDLKTSAKIGIGIGLGLGVPLILVAVFYLYSQYRRGSTAKEMNAKATVIDNTTTPGVFEKAELPATKRDIDRGTKSLNRVELSAATAGFEAQSVGMCSNGDQSSELPGISETERKELESSSRQPVELPADTSVSYMR